VIVCDCLVVLVVTLDTMRIISLHDSKLKLPLTTAVRFVFIAVDFKIRKYIPLILVRGYIQASACLYYTDCNTALY